MREDICSIPVNDVFLPREGCPFCRMRDMLEDRMATYITGAAMMEPDVRVETNRLGFCEEHFNQILARGSKLSVALILESLLHEVEEQAFPEGKHAGKRASAAVEARKQSCFICENIETNMRHLVDNTLKLWLSDPEFRALYSAQPYLCLSHYGMAMDAAQRLPKKEQPLFEQETVRLTKQYLQEVSGDVTHFCRMFDYRNAGGDWGNSKNAVERAIAFLTSREPHAEQKADEKNR